MHEGSTMARKTARRVAKTTGTSQARKPGAKSLAHKAAKRPAVKKAVTANRKPAAKRKVVKQSSALGRARVPGTADLDQMFLKDYEARQVFEFLRVKTVKELEEHTPDQIIQDLTAPLVRTVERIRKALAINNRYLAGDQKFAVQFTKQLR